MASYGDYRFLAVELSGRALTAAVNRPEKLNALNREVLLEMERLFSRAEADPEVGAVILTGAGDKSFVAGADIAELAQHSATSGRDGAVYGQSVLSRIERMPKPVIAAVNGYALGGGCELALACHLRVASTKARFGLPEVKLGLIPGYGGTQRLPRVVGTGRALELILTGEMISAEEAYRIGLANKLVAPEELQAAARALADQILKRGPLAVRYALEAVQRGFGKQVEDGLKMEADLFGLACATADMREGLAAFLEKRDARFQGK